MAQSFNITMLADERALVRGTDDAGVARQTVLDASEFLYLKQREAKLLAGKEFDEAVEKFFAPLTDAAEKFSKAGDAKRDDAFYVVIQEQEPGHEAKGEIVHKLTYDTVILRMIESGDTSRLLWVGSDIEILAPTPTNAATAGVPTVTPQN